MTFGYLDKDPPHLRPVTTGQVQMREPGMYAEKVDEMRTSEPVAITKVNTSQLLATFYESLDKITKYELKMHMCSVCIETRGVSGRN